MPVYIAGPSWTSGRLIAKTVDVILRERLGYATQLKWVVQTSREAWHLLADCNTTDTSQFCFTGPLGSGGHLAFEIWQAYCAGMYEKMVKEVPDRVPIRVSYPLGIGADGTEPMLVKYTALKKASEDSLFLQWYESWNGSKYDLSRYFDNHTSVPAPDFFSTYYLTGPSADAYVSATKDEACCKIESGVRTWHVSNGWALSPACRRLVAQGKPCVPLISYQAWGFPTFLQFAFFYDMPIAFGAYTWGPYVDLPSKYEVMLYWWLPDDTFINDPSKEVIFPAYNSDEHAQGIYKTMVSGGKLWKMAHAQIPVVEPPLMQFMEGFSISIQSIMALITSSVAVKGVLTDEDVICQWLKANRPIWEPWIPKRTSCVAGQGLVDSQGQFLPNETNAFQCEFCPEGKYSDNSVKATIFVCSSCDAGKYQSQKGKSACDECPSGTYVG